MHTAQSITLGSIGILAHVSDVFGRIFRLVVTLVDVTPVLLKTKPERKIKAKQDDYGKEWCGMHNDTEP